MPTDAIVASAANASLERPPAIHGAEATVPAALDVAMMAFRVLDHAVDDPVAPLDARTLEQTHRTLRALEGHLHGLTDRVGRQLEDRQMGPR